MKAKKVLLGLGLALMSNLASAQGLQGIVIEKFYQTNAADAANAATNGAVTTLNNGTTVYRVYVDMAAGYKFSQLFGTAAHPMKVNTTTNFYNDPNYGSTTNPSAISTTNLRKGTALIDSWFTTGGIAAGKLGVLKTEDTDGSPGNANNVLQNNPGGAFGLPINIGTTANAGAADGVITGTVVAPNVLGISTELDIFDQTAGNSFITTNGAIAALGGVVGPTASNMVLVGQFTTDGILTFELNVQLVNIATGAAENYVASAPTGTELTHPSLIFAPNVPPTVSITSPSNGASIITGTNLTLAATSADSDGTVTDVKFYVDGNLVGTDATAPYTASYTATAGAHTITAVSTDNDGDATTSSTVNISVANNQAPTISVSAPANAVAADVVNITATAADVDGTVAQVEFFVDNVSIGTDNASPFSMNWTATTGTHLIKAVATDDLGLTTTSSNATIVVAANNPPTAAITSPVSGASFIAPAVVTIDATATDADGTITQVEFFVNNVSVGVDNTAPYSFNWTSVIGAANITVKSTDDKGAVTTSSVVALNIADPAALPYEVGVIAQKCNLPTYCIPVSAAITNSVDNVKGYDMILNYDNTKLTPTGNITIESDMIDPTHIETANMIDNANGTMNISVYFKGTAPANLEFNSATGGKIICVEFTKTANFTQIDTAVVSVPFLQESYITGVQTKSVTAGKAITFRDSILPINITFWSDSSAVKYDAAAPNAYLVTNVYGADLATGVKNANNIAVRPDLNGNADYNLNNGLALMIDRDINGLNSVQMIVNAADAVLGKDLVLNNAFTPSIYQMLALDVNQDGVVSAGDVSQIKQRATLNIPEYQQAWNYDNAGNSNGQKSRDWIFVDSTRIADNAAYQISATFPSNDGVGFSKSRVPVVPFTLPATVTSFANCPVITEETYRAIMLGDVDGSYETYTADGLLKSNTEVVFDLANAKVVGNKVEVPVSIVSAENVRSLDFAFKFNENKLAFDAVVASNETTDGIAHFNTNDRTLRYSADNVKSFELDKQVATVSFEISGDQIEEKDIKSTFAMVNGKQAKISFNKAAAIAAVQSEITVYPNPANSKLNVVAHEAASIQILDMTGKNVVYSGELAANEKQEINVSDFANGIYLVRVFNNNFNTVERIVIAK